MSQNHSSIRRDNILSPHRAQNPQNNIPYQEEESTTSGQTQPQAALRRLIDGPPRTVQPSDLLILQRTLGNQAVGRLIQKKPDKSAPEPVSPATIQRVRLMESQTFRKRTGKPPKKLGELYEHGVRLIDNYHSLLQGFFQEALDEKYYTKALETKYGALMRSVVEALKPVFAELKEKTEQLFEKKKKGRVLALDIGLQKLNAFRQTVAELEDLVNKRMLVSTEIGEVREKILEVLEEFNQQNVEQFIENNPEKILGQQDLAPDSVQTNVDGGNVNKVGMGTYLPRQGGPIETPLTGYTKTGLTSEGKEAISEPGMGSDIPTYDPRAALRSVATYKVSELIGLDIIPRTVLTQFTNQEGKQRLGQVMEKVPGAPGQSGHHIDFTRKLEEGEQKQQLLQAFAILKNPESDPQALMEAKERVVGKFSEFGGEIYKNAAEGTITNFDWSNPVIERDLSTLQIFDLIIGHVDRHAGNLIVNYASENKNKVFGVKGIDNDDVMGRAFINPADPTQQGQGRGGFTDITKTPGLPPVLDFSVAVKLLNTDWKNIANELRTYTLPDPEIESAKKRWDTVIQHVLGLVTSNSLAFLGDRPDRRQMYQLRALMQSHGQVWVPNPDMLKQWGTEETTGMLTPANSYAGQYRDRARQLTEGNQLLVWNEPQYRG